MNIINISLNVLSVESFTNVPGQQDFTIAQCSYSQFDKDGNSTEYLMLIKAYNNQYDKSSSGSCADRLSKFTSGKKILVTGNY